MTLTECACNQVACVEMNTRGHAITGKYRKIYNREYTIQGHDDVHCASYIR